MGNTIQKMIVMPSIGNYIHRVNVIKGSLYSRACGINCTSIQQLVQVSHVQQQNHTIYKLTTHTHTLTDATIMKSCSKF